MDDPVRLLQRLGWEWRPDGLGRGLGPGVVIHVQVNGQKQATFVPLHRVWLSFDDELQKVGCPSAASVGAPYSIGGFFSFVSKAAKQQPRVGSMFDTLIAKAKVAEAARHAKMRSLDPNSAAYKAMAAQLAKDRAWAAAVHARPAKKGGVFKVIGGAIGRAAKKVVNVAKKAAVATLAVAMKPAQLVAHGLRNVPILGAIAGAGATLANLPINATSQLVQGKRIDKIAIGQFKDALSSVKTLGPYIQTVISFVPGIGTGISAGIGGALALASGKRIDQAFIEAAKGAIPGGPLAQAAFSVAEGVISGKPIDQIAINALPIPPAAKTALVQGLAAARDLAAGKRVDQIIIDRGAAMLPPALQKAVQVGTAIAQAKNIQQGIGAAAQGALAITGAHTAALGAAEKYAKGLRSPAIMSALQKGAQAQSALTNVVRHAQNGNQQAVQIVRAVSAVQQKAKPFRALTGRALPAPVRSFAPARALPSRAGMFGAIAARAAHGFA
jgi:hypothetical protein